jgi:hypothetical protein
MNIPFLFFIDELLMKISKQATQYSIQIDPNKPFQDTAEDIRNSLGICLISSVLSIKYGRHYHNTQVDT